MLPIDPAGLVMTGVSMLTDQASDAAAFDEAMADAMTMGAGNLLMTMAFDILSDATSEE